MAKVLIQKCESEVANGVASKQELFSRHNLELMYVGGDLYYGSGETAIERWLEMGEILFGIEKVTRAKLKERNWPADLIEVVSKEALMYGVTLPKLYSEIIGKTFESHRVNGDVRINRGHIFVIRAAWCLGFDLCSASNVHSHFSKLYQQG